MLKRKISVFLIILLFVFTSIFIVPHNKSYIVEDVISANKFVIDGKLCEIRACEVFDANFTENNLKLAKHLGISEEEAFVLGNLSKYWASNLIKGRKVYLSNSDDIFYGKYSYKTKFEYSGFCLRDLQPVSQKLFNKKLESLRKGNYKVLDLDNNNVYSYKDSRVKSLENFLVLRNSAIKNLNKESYISEKISQVFSKDKIKVLVSDSTVNLLLKKTCSDLVCKEILNNINLAKNTIDIAIYGYSSVPEIENALKSAIDRGVKLRMVYDRDSKGENIYPNTDTLVDLIKNNTSDFNSTEPKSIMHNKFYIFDNKILITGSANLSSTDMSGFNSNSIVVVKSEKLAQIYKNEFEQMYQGKFHSEKIYRENPEIKLDNVKIKPYFSPQDKIITNVVLPLIKNAKTYIYIPTFVLTEKRVTEELINAKKRGVEVKILIDALNASIKHSKHNELRNAGIAVKTENYAGKMHSKSMLIDDKYTIIGSMNFSNSGENRNDENLIVIEDSEITKFYKNFFMYQWAKVDDKWLRQNVRAESKDSIGSCQDGLDNNYDGFVDMEDLGCK